ncbi:MAG: hypothetical protein ACREAM_14565 [Blastocatellia bacterium]
MKQPVSSAPKCSLYVTLFIVLTIICSTSASAQSADKIIKQAVKAMTDGKGEKALREIRSWQVKGTVINTKDRTTGAYQASATQPDLYTTAFNLRGSEVSMGYNGRSAWMRDSRDGLRTLTGASSRDFQTEARYRNARWLDYKKEKSKLAFGGQSQINGKPANTVVLTTVKNVKIKLYFDAASGLLVREEMPAGEITRVFDYSDFRIVGAVMEPHSINLAAGDERYEIKLDQIIHNPQLDRAGFDFPKISDEPLPDIAALMEEVRKNQDELDKLLENYTYTQTVTDRELDSNGQMKIKDSQTFGVTFYKGARIRRLAAKNGQPLSPKEEADEQKNVEKHIREIEKKDAEKERKEREVARKKSKNPDGNPEGNPEGDPDNDRKGRFSVARALRASRFLNPRRERFRSRDVIVCDFEPSPDYKPRDISEELFGKMAGVIWIDPIDKEVARLEARFIRALKSGGGILGAIKEGGGVVHEQERVNQEVWLPTRLEINMGARLLFVGININRTATYGDYKRFNVEAKKEKLKTPAPSDKSHQP